MSMWRKARELTAIGSNPVVAPAGADAGAGTTVKIVIRRDTSANTNEIYGEATTVNVLLDLVTLTKVGV